MTCIVAVKGKGRVVLAGDAQVSGGWSSKWTMRNPKVFRRGPLMVGVSGSVRFANIVHHVLEQPSPPKRSAELERWVVREFTAQIRAASNAMGATEKKDGAEQVGGVMLAVVGGRIFEIYNDLCAVETSHDYATIGSGYLLAMGSLYATSGVALPEKRALLALEAAEAHDSGVRRPFTLLRSNET